MTCYLSKRFALFSSIIASLVVPGGVFGNFVEFSAGGTSDPNSIQATVDAFRAAVGNPNNGNGAATVGGRREINWDGGSTTNDTTSPGTTPFNVFLNTRGAQSITPGTGFLQAPPSGGPQGGFEGFFGNDTLGETFGVFSPLRLFTPVGSNITDVFFFLPGTNGGQPATVSAFGAVFTDVDLVNTTSIQFYDTSNALIYNQFVTPGTVANQSLSFLGALGDPSQQIARVRITTGNTAISSTSRDGGGVDLVAMDDFIYAEPVPEAGGIGLMILGLGAVLLCYRRCLAVA